MEVKPLVALLWSTICMFAGVGLYFVAISSGWIAQTIFG